MYNQQSIGQEVQSNNCTDVAVVAHQDPGLLQVLLEGVQWFKRKCKLSTRSRHSIDFSLLFLVFIPTVSLIVINKSGVFEAVFILIQELGIMSLFLYLWMACSNMQRSKLAQTIVLTFGAAYYVTVLFLMSYWFVTGVPFDIYFFTEGEIIATAQNILSIWSFLLLACGFVAAWYFSHVLLQKRARKVTADQVPVFRQFTAALVVFACIAALDTTPAYGYVALQVDQVFNGYKSRSDSESVASSGLDFVTESDDNVFILQLESTNALMFSGLAEVDGKKYKDVRMPEMEKIAKDGVYFPLFWGNAVQTNRAQISMFCNIIGNIGRSFSYNTDLIPHDCLPKILKKSGFKTTFYRADDLGFSGMGKFISNIGFDNIHQKDIMKEGDREYYWGYDDCAFYNRIFKHLKKNEPTPTKDFTYVEVSAHHMPFVYREEYKDVYEFDPVTNYAERYTNSAKMQDKCLGKFYKRFQKYAPENTHLFILGDTSWPVGINGSTYNQQGTTTDNFLVPMIYIPPKDRRDDYRVGTVVEDVVYSQTDLVPTIRDLLNGSDTNNSLVPLLQKPKKNIFSLLAKDEEEQIVLENYEQCHIMTQPYHFGGSFLVSKEETAYVYHMKTKTITVYDLQKDILMKEPIETIRDIEYEDFVDSYFCDRFMAESAKLDSDEKI